MSTPKGFPIEEDNMSDEDKLENAGAVAGKTVPEDVAQRGADTDAAESDRFHKEFLIATPHASVDWDNDYDHSSNAAVVAQEAINNGLRIISGHGGITFDSAVAEGDNGRNTLLSYSAPVVLASRVGNQADESLSNLDATVDQVITPRDIIEENGGSTGNPANPEVDENDESGDSGTGRHGASE